MKITLVRIPDTLDERYGKLQYASVLPPLGLAYIASYLRIKGFSDIKIIDGVALNLSINETIDMVLDYKTEVVGIQTFTFNYKKVLEVCRLLKEKDSDIITILGGPHLSLFPEDVMRNDFVDYAVIGEGEISFYNLVNKLSKKEKYFSDEKGICWKNNGKININRELNLIHDLSEMPPPARDLLPMYLYKSTFAKKGKRPSHVISSRGCPFKCGYCTSSQAFGRKVRVMNPENIIEEIEQLINTYGIDEIQFFDDMFTINKKNVMEFCELMISKKINIPWRAHTRVDSVDEEMLAAMKRAGCYLLSYGIESGSEKILKIINKKITLEQAEKTVALTKKAGILTQTMFMLALPGETYEDSRKTIKFARKLNAEIVAFTPYIPGEGTALYELASKSGTIENIPIDQRVKVGEVHYIPEGRDKKEVENTAKNVYMKYYFRLTNIPNLINIWRNYPVSNLARLFIAMIRNLSPFR